MEHERQHKGEHDHHVKLSPQYPQFEYKLCEYSSLSKIIPNQNDQSHPKWNLSK
jgi:hypothetical protein